MHARTKVAPGMDMVTPSALMEMARDPMLIKGIYDVCDQWCMYCSVTTRCLAYRCCGGTTRMRDSSDRNVENDDHDNGDDDDRLLERLMTVKCLAEAEGRLAPAEIETMLSGDRERQHRMLWLDDPLERLGRQYMITAAAYLSTRADDETAASPSAVGPTPLEVFEWFHALVPARIFRALISDLEARQGVPGRRNDTLATAKLVLVGIDRSLAALTSLAAEGDDPRAELLLSLLRRLGPEVERRFPDAGRYVRAGLDEARQVRSRWWLRRLRSIRWGRSG